MYKYEDLNFNQIINDSNIDMDSPEALYAIACCYRDGKGVEKSEEQIEQATRRKQGIDQEADRRIGESREQAQKLLSDANTEADRILKTAEAKAAGIDAEAKARIADADRREREAARTVDQARRLLADAAARLARPVPELPATNPRE